MANQEHLDTLNQGVDAWNKWRKETRDIKPDLSGANLSMAKLSMADLSETNLSGANLRNANLNGANLSEANLKEAGLSGAHLIGANLIRANLREAGLSGAHLSGANLNRADLSNANLSNADLNGANLREANLREAGLIRADLNGANLREADLSGANLRRMNLEESDVSGAKITRRTKCRGIRVATCYGSAYFKRTIQDQDFLEEFQEHHKIWYSLWWVSCDCGRSVLRWLGCCVLIVLCFAHIFYLFPSDAFQYHSLLPWNLHTTIYYSVVTFTTLGFGDIAPNTTAAANAVMTEVILGYVMLAGLISIFANKLARRS